MTLSFTDIEPQLPWTRNIIDSIIVVKIEEILYIYASEERRRLARNRAIQDDVLDSRIVIKDIDFASVTTRPLQLRLG